MKKLLITTIIAVATSYAPTLLADYPYAGPDANQMRTAAVTIGIGDGGMEIRERRRSYCDRHPRRCERERRRYREDRWERKRDRYCARNPWDSRCDRW